MRLTLMVATFFLSNTMPAVNRRMSQPFSSVFMSIHCLIMGEDDTYNVPIVKTVSSRKPSRESIKMTKKQQPKFLATIYEE
jgi:hypothetical protein